jgi:hypothetical protein
MNEAQEGHRMRKSNEQQQVLESEFKRNPKWNFRDKVRIGNMIGMTHI